MSTVTTTHTVLRPSRRWAAIAAILALAATGLVLGIVALTSGGSSSVSSPVPVRVLPASELRQYPGVGVPRPLSAEPPSRSAPTSIERQTPGARP